MNMTGVRGRFAGTNLTIFVTWRCNLPCSYCSLLATAPNTRPVSEFELTADEWIDRVRGFPVRLRDIYITGGEPSLYKDTPKLINGLLALGYHVLVFSNLKRGSLFMDIKPHRRFKIQATYHKCDDIERFDSEYERLNAAGYRMSCDEFTIQSLPYSELKAFDNPERWKIPNFRYSPDGKLFTCVWDLYWATAKPMKK